jgi:hypothetical protein
VLARSGRLAGFGATAAMARPGLDFRVTVDAIARLVEAAFGR